MTQPQPRMPSKSGALLSKRMYGTIALLAILAAVMAACGSRPNTASEAQANNGNTPTATTVPSAATATPTSSTSTHTSPTATPVPPLQGTVLVKPLGSSIPGQRNSQIVDITCPSGYLVAGGGISSGATAFTIMWNAPISTTTWRGEVYNYATNSIYAVLQVMCMKASGLTGKVVIKSMGPINSGQNSAQVDVSCPSGYLVAGGGINAGYGELMTMWSAPVNTTTWREEVYNFGLVNASGQVQVECLKVSGLVGKWVAANLGNSIAPGTHSSPVSIICPSGYLVAGGGLNSGYHTQTLMQSEPINTTTWRSEVYNSVEGIGGISAQAQAVCLKR